MEPIRVIAEQTVGGSFIRILWIQRKTNDNYMGIQQVQKKFIIKESEKIKKLIVENHSSYPIIMTDGDILIGGNQNRTLQHSLIIEPGISEIPVYCIESGRWDSEPLSEVYKEYGSEDIWNDSSESLISRRYRRYISNAIRELSTIEYLLKRGQCFYGKNMYWLTRDIRRVIRQLNCGLNKPTIMLQERKLEKRFTVFDFTMTYQARMVKIIKDQDEVWNEIKRELNKFSKTNITCDYSQLFEGFQKLRFSVPENANGLIIVYNSIPVVFESISNPKVFKDYASKFIHSYLLYPFAPKRRIQVADFIKEIQNLSFLRGDPKYISGRNRVYEGKNFKILNHKHYENAHILYLNNI